MPATYIEHSGKVLETDTRFKHFMAVVLDPQTQNRRGIVRCIMSRDGDVAVEGFIDRSELHCIESVTLDTFSVHGQLAITNQQEVLAQLTDGDSRWDFLGLEDPDIWVDPDTGLTHVFFTIAFKHPVYETAICLGHAQGESLDTLTMTAPALLPKQFKGAGNGAKEVSIAPKNSSGVRLNLVESADGSFNGESVSVVQVAAADDMGSTWSYGPIAFHPLQENIPWIGGHASPGPLLPRSFIDVGEGKLIGIMNGREANRREGNETIFGMFSIGLCIYNYEFGKIEWVSPEPLIRDSEARTITFASHFVETFPGEGILYAHVDDSFVRAYTLYAEGIRAQLP